MPQVKWKRQRDLSAGSKEKEKERKKERMMGYFNKNKINGVCDWKVRSERQITISKKKRERERKREKERERKITFEELGVERKEEEEGPNKGFFVTVNPPEVVDKQEEEEEEAEEGPTKGLLVMVRLEGMGEEKEEAGRVLF